MDKSLEFDSDFFDQFIDSNQPLFTFDETILQAFEDENKETQTSENYQCNHCLKHFSNLGNLNRHIREKHNKGTEKYRCLNCTKVYTRKENLKRHEKKCKSKRGRISLSKDYQNKNLLITN